MPIGVYFRFPDTTLDQYEQVCRGVTGGRTMERLSDWPGGGCLSHAAWAEEDGGLRVFDVWESPEAFQRFGETLMPQVQAAGLPEASPHIVQLHNWVNS
jgi:hypothetical protein